MNTKSLTRETLTNVIGIDLEENSQNLAAGYKLVQAVLTSTSDFLVWLVAAVVIELSVRIVQDGPAGRVLHSVRVTLVVNLAAPIWKWSIFWDKLYKAVWGIRCVSEAGGDLIVTCPDHPQVCQSLPFHSSSRSQHSQKQVSYQASHTGSSF